MTNTNTTKFPEPTSVAEARAHLIFLKEWLHMNTPVQEITDDDTREWSSASDFTLSQIQLAHIKLAEWIDANAPNDTDTYLKASQVADGIADVMDVLERQVDQYFKQDVHEQPVDDALDTIMQEIQEQVVNEPLLPSEDEDEQDNNEALNHVYTDLLMLASGEWEPDDDSIDSSLSLLREGAAALGVKLVDTRVDYEVSPPCRLEIVTAMHSMSWQFNTRDARTAVTDVLDELEQAFDVDFNYRLLGE